MGEFGTQNCPIELETEEEEEEQESCAVGHKKKRALLKTSLLAKPSCAVTQSSTIMDSSSLPLPTSLQLVPYKNAQEPSPAQEPLASLNSANPKVTAPLSPSIEDLSNPKIAESGSHSPGEPLNPGLAESLSAATHGCALPGASRAFKRIIKGHTTSASQASTAGADDPACRAFKRIVKGHATSVGQASSDGADVGSSQKTELEREMELFEAAEREEEARLLTSLRYNQSGEGSPSPESPNSMESIQADWKRGPEDTLAEQPRAKRGRKAQALRKGEDVCFACFDGGDLILCDKRSCPKAYHMECTGRESEFFLKKGQWLCGWHVCAHCSRAATMHCYTCPNAYCNGCTKEADFLFLRKGCGLCELCYRIVYMIEHNLSIDSEGVEVNFHDEETYECLFQDYWKNLKQGLSITWPEIEKAHKAKEEGVPLGKRLHTEDEDYELSSDSDSRPTTRQSQRLKRKRVGRSVDFMSGGEDNVELDNGDDKVRKQRKSRKKLDDARHLTGDLSNYAAIDVKNISLIYLKRSLLEDLRGDSDFESKVMGAFVRIRVPSMVNKNETCYRLVQIVGVKQAFNSRSNLKTADVMLEILNLQKREEITVDLVSSQDFTEEECQRLRQSVKCGLLKAMTVGELREKARVLREAKVKDWFDTELLRLSHLRDRASEKGRKKELRECVERLQVLSSPAERERQLRAPIEVNTDPHMDPDYESDNAGSLVKEIQGTQNAWGTGFGKKRWERNSASVKHHNYQDNGGWAEAGPRSETLEAKSKVAGYPQKGLGIDNLGHFSGKPVQGGGSVPNDKSLSAGTFRMGSADDSVPADHDLICQGSIPQKDPADDTTAAFNCQGTFSQKGGALGGGISKDDGWGENSGGNEKDIGWGKSVQDFKESDGWGQKGGGLKQDDGWEGKEKVGGNTKDDKWGRNLGDNTVDDGWGEDIGSIKKDDGWGCNVEGLGEDAGKQKKENRETNVGGGMKDHNWDGNVGISQKVDGWGHLGGDSRKDDGLGNSAGVYNNDDGWGHCGAGNGNDGGWGNNAGGNYKDDVWGNNAGKNEKHVSWGSKATGNESTTRGGWGNNAGTNEKHVSWGSRATGNEGTSRAGWGKGGGIRRDYGWGANASGVERSSSWNPRDLGYDRREGMYRADSRPPYKETEKFGRVSEGTNFSSAHTRGAVHDVNAITGAIGVGMAMENEKEKVWYYQDPSKTTQGPFSMEQLRKWEKTKLFPLDLKVWRVTESQDASILLTDALLGRFSNDLPPGFDQHDKLPHNHSHMGRGSAASREDLRNAPMQGNSRPGSSWQDRGGRPRWEQDNAGKDWTAENRHAGHIDSGSGARPERPWGSQGPDKHSPRDGGRDVSRGHWGRGASYRGPPDHRFSQRPGNDGRFSTKKKDFPCRYFARGLCKKGDECDFMH